MRKNRSAIAAILLAVSMMTACAGGQTTQTSAGSSAAVEATAAAGSSAAVEATAAAGSSAAEGKTGSAGQVSASAGQTSAAENSGTAAGKTGAVSEAEIPAGAVTVKMNGNGAEISGAGAEYADGTLEITKGGTYVLSGALEGQVLLETDKKEEVTIFLNGAEITSEKAYAIASVKGKTVSVILVAGTENILTAKGVADDDNAQTEEEEADAAIYVKNDLTVSGTGALKITSAGKGIHAKDTLTLADGVIDLLIDLIDTLLLFLLFGSEVLLFLLEFIEHRLRFLLVARQFLLLFLLRLEGIAAFFLALGEFGILLIDIRLCRFDSSYLFLAVTGKLTKIAHAAHHLLEIGGREHKEQG